MQPRSAGTALQIRRTPTQRCDVLWCNEPLGVLHLHDQALLAPYRGNGFARIPAAWKDPAGHWVGFAARLRVWITTKYLAAHDAAGLEAELARRAETATLDAFAMAVPLFGTTRFHVTAWQALRGKEAAQRWLRTLREGGARFVRGNAAVRDLVQAGAAQFGFTDTDDAAAVPVEVGVGVQAVEIDGHTLCMPNAVAIVRDCRHRADAELLVDFLLSQETELALAQGKGRQVPLGPVPPAALPPAVAALQPALARALPLASLATVHADVLAWLRAEWLRP